MVRAGLLVTVLVVVPLRGVSAQGASDAARQFLDAHARSEWTVMASWVDSASLSRNREAAMRVANTSAMMSSPGVRAMIDSSQNEFLRTIGSMTGAMGPDAMLRLNYARVTTVDEIRAMSDQELMARWFEAKSPEHLIRMTAEGPMASLIRQAGVEPQAMSAAMSSSLDAVRVKRWDLVGEVVESADVAHVVFRNGDREGNPTAVLTFRKGSDGMWRIHFVSPEDQLLALSSSLMAGRRPGGR